MLNNLQSSFRAYSYYVSTPCYRIVLCHRHRIDPHIGIAEIRESTMNLMHKDEFSLNIKKNEHKVT